MIIRLLTSGFVNSSQEVMRDVIHHRADSARAVATGIGLRLHARQLHLRSARRRPIAVRHRSRVGSTRLAFVRVF
jgi:hypothetical protein